MILIHGTGRCIFVACRFYNVIINEASFRLSYFVHFLLVLEMSVSTHLPFLSRTVKECLLQCRLNVGRNF